MTRLVFLGVDLAGLARRQRADGAIIIRWADRDDAPALRAAAAGEAAEGLSTGAPLRTAIAIAEGRIVGRNSYCVGTVDAGWFELRIQPTDVVAFDGHVVPEFRGRRLLADIKTFAAGEFRREGYRRMVSWSRGRNTASLRAHAAIGAQRLCRLKRIKLRRFSIVFCRGRIWAGLPGRNRFTLEL